MIIYIKLQFTLEAHNQLIEEYGGKEGILDLSLLKSALEMPKASFNGKYLHRTVFDKAAAYLYHIAKNHAFVDGNKRTAAMISLSFLATNGVYPFFMLEKDFEGLILRTANGKASKKEIAAFFRAAKKAGKSF